MTRWPSRHSHRGGRLEEAQTSGAGWVPCDVYGRSVRKEVQAARMLQAELSGGQASWSPRLE